MKAAGYTVTDRQRRGPVSKMAALEEAVSTKCSQKPVKAPKTLNCQLFHITARILVAWLDIPPTSRSADKSTFGVERHTDDQGNKTHHSQSTQDFVNAQG